MLRFTASAQVIGESDVPRIVPNRLTVSVRPYYDTHVSVRPYYDTHMTISAP